MSGTMMRRILAFDVQAQELGGLSKRFHATLERLAESKNKSLA